MITFVNITEDEFLENKLLYKHMPLENALRSLNEKYLWFANPFTWKDPFEKRFLEAKYIKKGKEVGFIQTLTILERCGEMSDLKEPIKELFSQLPPNY